MMSLLRLVTLQYLRQHPLRTCLTILGVAFGIAIFVAIRVTNLSTRLLKRLMRSRGAPSSMSLEG